MVGQQQAMLCIAYDVQYNKHPLTYIGMIQVLHYPYFSEELYKEKKHHSNDGH